MNRHLLFIPLAFIFLGGPKVQAYGNSDKVPGMPTVEIQKKGEKIFLKHVDRCLSLMVQAAKELQVEGVAVMVFIPGERTSSGVSKMKVVGSMTRDNMNFLAVAHSKIAEMADTYLDSGSKTRKPLTGETGWRGGLVKKVGSGYIMAAFSGGTEDEDNVVARAGIEGMLNSF